MQFVISHCYRNVKICPWLRVCYDPLGPQDSISDRPLESEEGQLSQCLVVESNSWIRMQDPNDLKFLLPDRNQQDCRDTPSNRNDLPVLNHQKSGLS